MRARCWLSQCVRAGGKGIARVHTPSAGKQIYVVQCASTGRMCAAVRASLSRPPNPRAAVAKTTLNNLIAELHSDSNSMHSAHRKRCQHYQRVCNSGLQHITYILKAPFCYCGYAVLLNSHSIRCCSRVKSAQGGAAQLCAPATILNSMRKVSSPALTSLSLRLL